MKNLNKKVFHNLLLLLMLTGCVKLESEFTNVDGDETIKITIKKDNGKNLIMKCVLIDKSDKVGTMIIVESNNCEYFDEDDWICRDPYIVKMKDGKLTIYTDGKAQVFTSEKKLKFK